MNIPSVIRLIGATFFLSILPLAVHALTPGQVFNKVKDTIFVVKTMDAQDKLKGQGSGVLLSSGKIVTNCHVVEGGASYQVGRGNLFVRATLYAEDEDKDICLLDVKGITGKPAQLGKAANLKVGDPVYAVGAPKGLELSLSDGIVAQLRGGPPPFIQTTAAISPGSSGGGLFDGEGRLVGLTTLYVEGGQSLNFAMPVEWISEIKPGHKPSVEDHSDIPEGDIALRDTAASWYQLGMKCYFLNRYNDAIEAFRKAVGFDTEFVDAWNELGTMYINVERYDDAIEAFHQALRINPKHTDAWHKLGITYINLKRYDDAIEVFRQALSFNPKSAQIWYDLGDIYIRSGNRSAALDAVRELQRLDSGRVDELLKRIVPR